ncbi:hypothetical protein [Deinococcus sp. Leaf326]|uniref:hypothetical protein n=1 Tax=Deinococcus sp. Leaf326 TaxID=1736338 RepID=UPI0006FF4414|nr:hypothetical protein [Deinococcus sp. Leaf326]KQR33160.1 hypothetical protein ASF71_16855 [Deinococcus sp. Leaf326]
MILVWVLLVLASLLALLCLLAPAMREGGDRGGPAVTVPLPDTPPAPAGLLVVWREEQVEDMRFLMGPVPELRRPVAPEVCPICHRADCGSALANCTERWR